MYTLPPLQSHVHYYLVHNIASFCVYVTSYKRSLPTDRRRVSVKDVSSTHYYTTTQPTLTASERRDVTYAAGRLLTVIELALAMICAINRQWKPSIYGSITHSKHSVLALPLLVSQFVTALLP